MGTSSIIFIKAGGKTARVMSRMDGYLSAVGPAVGLAFASAPFERLKAAALSFVQEVPPGQRSVAHAPARASAAFLNLCDGFPVDEVADSLGAFKRAPPNLAVPYIGLGAALMAGPGSKMKTKSLDADCLYRVDFDEKTFSRLCSVPDGDWEAKEAVAAWSIPLSDFERFDSCEALGNAFAAMGGLSPAWGDDPLPLASQRARAILAAHSCAVPVTRFGMNEGADRLRLESMGAVSWSQVRSHDVGYCSKLSYEMYSEEDWLRLSSVCGTAMRLGGPGAVLARGCRFENTKGTWLFSMSWVTNHEDEKADELVRVMGEGLEEMVKRWGINICGEHGPVRVETGSLAPNGSGEARIAGSAAMDMVSRSLFSASMQGWLDLSVEQKAKACQELAASDELRQSVALCAAMSGSMLAAFNPLEALRFFDALASSGLLGDLQSLEFYARHWLSLPASCVAGASERLIPCWMGEDVPSKYSFVF